MENASKALLMAASMLIALIIIGALILMFNSLSNYQRGETVTTKEQQVISFNNQYETYNRKDVRGSDLYSLLNRVIDYNRRKSTKGTGKKDEGQYLAYQPMTIKVKINNPKVFSIDETNRLIKGEYEQSENKNVFEEEMNDKIAEAESKLGGATNAQNLCAAMTRIFTNPSTKEEKITAIRNYNKAIGKEEYQVTTTTGENTINTYWSKIDSKKTYVYRYYEYMQFKRGKFDCTEVEYNNETGRIVSLTFEFNGSFD